MLKIIWRTARKSPTAALEMSLICAGLALALRLLVQDHRILFLFENLLWLMSALAFAACVLCVLVRSRWPHF